MIEWTGMTSEVTLKDGSNEFTSKLGKDAFGSNQKFKAEKF